MCPTREKVFGEARGIPLDRNAKVRIMVYAIKAIGPIRVAHARENAINLGLRNIHAERPGAEAAPCAMRLDGRNKEEPSPARSTAFKVRRAADRIACARST